MRRLAVRLILLLVVLSVTFGAGTYRLIKRIPIAGDDGWDYITADTEGRRLYVPHGGELVVIDLDSNATIGKITGQTDTHGVAVAREYGRGFLDATDPGSVIIFDLKTLTVIDKVRVGDDPNGIIFDHKTGRIFTADRGSKRVTAIDAKTGKIVATSPGLGGRTEHLAADESGHVFINMQDVGKLHKLDAQTLKILETWPTAPCGQPSSMDMDRANGRIFVGCRSGALTVFNANSGKIVASQPIGPGVDAVEFDSKTGLIYASTGGDGTLSIVHEDGADKYTLVQNVKTLSGARTLAVDRQTGKVYLPAAERGPIPAATAANPRPRAPMIPGSFSVLVVGQ